MAVLLLGLQAGLYQFNVIGSRTRELVETVLPDALGDQEAFQEIILLALRLFTELRLKPGRIRLWSRAFRGTMFICLPIRSGECMSVDNQRPSLELITLTLAHNHQIQRRIKYATPMWQRSMV